jgi:hypothetical protein
LSFHALGAGRCGHRGSVALRTKTLQELAQI